MKQQNLAIFFVGISISVIFLVILLNSNSRDVDSVVSPKPNEEVSQETPKKSDSLVDTDSTEPSASDKKEQSMQETKKTYTKPFELELKEGVNYKAVLTTTKGVITIDLFEKEAPKTVNNFVALVNDGYYNGIIFHRVIEDFMIQGGDPTGTGTGGPGYQFEDEQSGIKLVKGSLAMANSGPATNGSQFFIVTAASTPWLDGKHTNFGVVTDGLDVVEAISKVQKDAGDKPLDPVVITKAEIIEE